jgi:response regulator RpfG family c-di-GMP phosphodiesterase
MLGMGETGGFKGRPILVVDDEPSNLELLQRFLRGTYGPILVAEDGEQGLNILEKEPVHLILSDQRMPRMDGVTMFQRALEVQPDAKRVLVTGHTDLDMVIAAINAGQAYQYVTKPIDFKALDVIIRRALEAYESAVRERLLFDSFVRASVTAIEQRDPSTAGHSARVANMTVGFARVLHDKKLGSLGRHADLSFSRDDLEQIRFASLLHDFGKIGVREHVLVKSHKLPPDKLQLIELRIEHAARTGEATRDEAHAMRVALMTLNDPFGSPAGQSDMLALLSRMGVLSGGDEDYLRITRGSLSLSERAEIEAHVRYTIGFLEQIPWPNRLSRVVQIAGAHHEKLNGRGYPYGLSEIPIEARMMAIADIYDALTAADRPYKTALPHEAALDILASSVRNGELDEELYTIFREGHVYELALEPVEAATSPSPTAS